MFSYKFHLFIGWWCVAWLGIVAGAMARSNQPLEIEESRSPIGQAQTQVPHRVSAAAAWQQDRITHPQALPVPAVPSTPQAPVTPKQPLVSGPRTLPQIRFVEGKPRRQLGGLSLAQEKDKNLAADQENVVGELGLLDQVERQSLGQASQAAEQEDALVPQGVMPGAKWLVQTLGALGVVVGLILLLRAFLSRMAGRSSVAGNSPVLEVLSRTSIAPRNHIVLIRMGHRILVVGDSSAGLRTLTEITDPQEVAVLLAGTAAAKPRSISRNFNQLLGRFNSSYQENDRGAEEGADTSEHRVDRARDQLSSLLNRVRNLSGRGGAV